MGNLRNGDDEGSADDERATRQAGTPAPAAEGRSSEGLGDQIGHGPRGVRTRTEDDGSQESPISAPLADPADVARYTPLFRAQHEDRYLRQRLIRSYEQEHDCRLVVMIDQIDPMGITYFAELLHAADVSRDLHVMLWSPGGDGETAVRLVRMAQAACQRLVLVVPDMAKSAATILGLGAHEIVMGPSSDLGPIDPQVLIPGRGYVGAKDMIAAVEGALNDVAQRSDTFPLHAAMLGGIDETTVQFARSALARTGKLARQAVASQPDRSDDDVDLLMNSIDTALIATPDTHGAVVGAPEAHQAGLPVRTLDMTDPWWAEIWTLWTRYFSLAPPFFLRAYESATASQVQIERQPAEQ